MPKKIIDPNAPVQNPNYFLNKLIEVLALKNDAALGRVLQVSPPVLSKIRHLRLPVTAGFLLKAYDATDLSIEALRTLLHAQPAE